MLLVGVEMLLVGAEMLLAVAEAIVDLGAGGRVKRVEKNHNLHCARAWDECPCTSGKRGQICSGS